VDGGRPLQETGLAHLRGAIEPSAAAAMADVVWRALGTQGIERVAPATWPSGPVDQPAQQRRDRSFEPFTSATLVAAADELVGVGWSAAGTWGPVLVTFPERGPWALPDRGWHVDLPGRGPVDRLAALRLYGCLTDVGPGGGGTLVVEGSHELVRRLVASSPGHDAGSSAQLRAALAERHRWLRALAEGGGRLRSWMTGGEEVDGVRVRVVEVTGAAGDVVVMLPWTMHNRSMNTSSQPRFALTHTFLAAPRAHPADQGAATAATKSARRSGSVSRSGT
jgi:ectoine hydroxylase-related dioxygenase (phytanoyl-CoA dioxygenase family)